MQGSTSVLLRQLALLTLLILTGCGGSKAGSGPRPAPGSAGPSAQPPALGLPAIDGLNFPRTGSSQWELLRQGAEFDAGLLHLHLSTDNTDGVFGATADSPSGIACAIYHFKTLGYSAEPEIRYTWSSAPDDLSHAWLALGNFRTRLWDFRPMDATGLASYDNFSDYLSPAGDTLVAVILSGPDAASLKEIRIGLHGNYDEVEPNDSEPQANVLPVLPVLKFTGSMGNGPGYPGYDGDEKDCFKLNVAGGKHMSIVVNYSTRHCSSAAPPHIALLSNSGAVLLTQTALVSPLDIMNFSTDAAQAPYYVEIGPGGYFDYELSIVAENKDPGKEPVAFVTASPNAGAAPLTVTLDASRSHDTDSGDSIVDYRWDWDDDGVIDFDSGTQPVVQHTYESAGIYQAVAEVTDTHGLSYYSDQRDASPPGSCCITVGPIPYDEREDNDASWGGDYDALPALPFANFRGNVGFGPLDSAYNDDAQDCYHFSALANQSLRFLLSTGLSGAGGTLGLRILDGQGSTLAYTQGRDKTSVGFIAPAAGTYVLKADSGSVNSATDYTLKGGFGLPPSVSLAGDPLSGLAPLQVDFTATASDSNGSIVKYEWDLDDDGNFELDSGAEATLSHVFNYSGDVNCRVRATDQDGMVTVSAPVDVQVINPAYDEVEDDDSVASACPLPALPFSTWIGNCGVDGPNNGDAIDFLRLPAGLTQADGIKVSLDLQTSGGCSLYFRDGDGNLSMGSWSLSSLNNVLLATSAGYNNPVDGYVLELAGATGDYRLSVESSDLPIPSLVPSVSNGSPPLMVTLDASASTDSDGIANFAFDPDGTGWVNNGTDPFFHFTYNNAGSYVPQLRVTDTKGFSNTVYFVNHVNPCFKQILVGSAYNDELEDNDNAAQANNLPAFPFTDFDGSVGAYSGTYASYNSYDGDFVDWLRFNAPNGHTVTFTIHQHPGLISCTYWLIDANGSTFSEATANADNQATVTMQYTINSQPGPYYLVCDAGSAGVIEYSIDGSITQ